MYRQVNPSRPGRTAMAPYNFVPLPEKVLEVGAGLPVQEGGPSVKPWEHQDRYVHGTHSGTIEFRLETLTPVYVRGTRRPGDFRESRLRPEPFRTADGRIAIPGSSLRGMVRSLVEILSFSKPSRVSEQKPFFRTVGNDRLGLAYRARMVTNNQKPRGGYLQHRNGQWAIVEAPEVLRVTHPQLNTASRGVYRYKLNPSYCPTAENRTLQYVDCWVKRAQAGERCTDVVFQQPSGPDWLKGTVVLTGSAPGGHGAEKAEFVLLKPGAGPTAITIPASLWLRFLDDDQITGWQEKNFPKDWPAPDSRKPGHPLDGEPVFFLCDAALQTPENPAGLVFFGRAQMFRLPYDSSPRDLVPTHIHQAGLDMTEAIFGRVTEAEGADASAHRGRVRFEDAFAEGQATCLPAMVPEILSSPKPTAFQHYLVQDGTKPKELLHTYLRSDSTITRGHKLYWHRWEGARGIEQVQAPGQPALVAALAADAASSHRQNTLISPVDSTTVFNARIRFENLTSTELGALVASLELPKGCAHRIGMGKPLGLGSVRVSDLQVAFTNAAERYTGWESGRSADDEKISASRRAFEDAVMTHAKASAECLLDGEAGLARVARLKALYLLLTWETRPPRDEPSGACDATRSLKIQGGDVNRYGDGNEFKARPVLPTPHHVLSLPEPGWSVTPQPPPGKSSQQQPAKVTPGGEKSAPAAPLAPAQQSKSKRAGYKPGDTVRCVVFLHPKTRKLRFRVKDGTQEGILDSKSAPLPEEMQKPATEVVLKVRVTAQGAGTWRFLYEPPGGGA